MSDSYHDQMSHLTTRRSMYQNHQTTRKASCTMESEEHPRRKKASGKRTSTQTSIHGATGVMQTITKRNHAHHHEKRSHKKRKVRTNEKRHKRTPLPPTPTFLPHRKIQAQSKTYTCEIPLATPWPLVHSKIKATGSNRHFFIFDLPLGYSLFYTPVC